MLMAIAVSVPIADAASSQAPFITIDPIGNQTVDSAFFINGTTNLAAGTVFQLKIETTNFNPGGAGSDLVTNVTVQPGQDGVNQWSYNVTPNLWETCGPGSCQVSTPGSIIPGEYLVMVTSAQAYNSTPFFLFPAQNSRAGGTPSLPGTSPVTEASPQSPAGTQTTTQSSPLPVAVPVAGVASLVIARSLTCKKR